MIIYLLLQKKEMKNNFIENKENIKQLIKFGIVGLSNTLIGTIIIYLCYNVFETGYWLSSGIGYLVGGIWSYILNKNFTFKCKKHNISIVIKYIVNLLTCYFIAYLIARPLCVIGFTALYGQTSSKVVDNISFLIGLVIYTIINFWGQKFFCFTTKNDNVAGRPVRPAKGASPSRWKSCTKRGR